MLSLLSSSLLLLALCCVLSCRAQLCDTAQNTNQKGLNPACSSTRPYCVGGGCEVCNPYALDDYICDCPAGKGCSRDFSPTGKSATCVTMPKYGSSCSKQSDCLTMYTGREDYNVQLVCVSGTCRYCDPLVSGTGNDTTCPTGVSQAGQERNCILPGLWGVPGPSSATNLAAATVAAATAGQQGPASTTTSSAVSITLLFHNACAVITCTLVAISFSL